MSTMEKDVGVSVSKRLARMAVLVALSGVGAFIKIPARRERWPDSAPGYLGALVFGSKGGAVIAALGHLLRVRGQSVFPIAAAPCVCGHPNGLSSRPPSATYSGEWAWGPRWWQLRF